MLLGSYTHFLSFIQSCLNLPLHYFIFIWRDIKKSSVLCLMHLQTYALNKANLCGTRPLKDVSHLTWVFVNENVSSSHPWSHCYGWCILNRFSMNLHTGACPVHVLCIIITDLWHSFDMLNTRNKRRPGVSDLCSLTALFFHFFILALCHLSALWLMFTKQRNHMTEREREIKKESRLFGNVFDVCLSSFPFSPKPV